MGMVVAPFVVGRGGIAPVPVGGIWVEQPHPAAKRVGVLKSRRRSPVGAWNEVERVVGAGEPAEGRVLSVAASAEMRCEGELGVDGGERVSLHQDGTGAASACFSAHVTKRAAG